MEEQREVYVDVLDAAILDAMEAIIFICEAEELELDEKTQVRQEDSFSILIASLSFLYFQII